MMRPRQCKRESCRAWANRSGYCPQHDRGARERMRRVWGAPVRPEAVRAWEATRAAS